MAAHGRVSVTTSATALVAPGDIAGVYIFRNLHASTDIDVGDSGVTSGAGLLLKAGEVLNSLPVGAGEGLYAIAGSGTVSVAWLRVGS